MIHKKLLRDVKLKNGQTIAKDTVCAIEFFKTEYGSAMMSVCPTNGEPFKTRSYSIFFKAPSMANLEKWSNDGICKTVTGHRTEPDGYGSDGSPSWLLALGMI